jgi:hypothetical protein
LTITEKIKRSAQRKDKEPVEDVHA